MAGYLLKTSYRLAFYLLYTIFLCYGFFYFVINVWIGESAIYLVMTVLWGGFYYIWNLITAEISIDLIDYYEAKMPDADYYTIPRIAQRIKIWIKKSLRVQ